MTMGDENKKEPSSKGFYIRKVVHFVLTTVFLLYFYFGLKYLGLQKTLFFATIVLLIEVLVEFMRVEYPKLAKSHRVNHIAKAGELTSFSTITYSLVIGIVLFAVFDANIAFAALSIALYGDVAAALIGRTFGKRDFLTKGKTLEGFLAHVTVGFLVSLLFLPFYQGAILALVAAFGEIHCSNVEDNFMMPLVIAFIAFLLQMI